VQTLKDSGADKAAAGTPERVSYEKAVARRKDLDNEISARKNGGSVIVKNPITGNPELKVFGEKGKKEAEAAGYKNGVDFKLEDATKELDKKINYEEKNRARDYFKNKAHDVKKDTYADALRPNMSSVAKTLKGALRDALIGGLAAGPLGAVAGALVGASRENGAILNRLVGVFESNNKTLLGLGHTNLSGRAQSYEEDQLKSDPHYHAKSFKDSYKSPSKDFFKMFEGLGGGGGHGGGDHGGGHDDHGHGGHDDHGGGDHGGGHH
jgi:uncharacterized membrane protein YgcG